MCLDRVDGRSWWWCHARIDGHSHWWRALVDWAYWAARSGWCDWVCGWLADSRGCEPSGRAVRGNDRSAVVCSSRGGIDRSTSCVVDSGCRAGRIGDQRTLGRVTASGVVVNRRLRLSRSVWRKRQGCRLAHHVCGRTVSQCSGVRAVRRVRWVDFRGVRRVLGCLRAALWVLDEVATIDQLAGLACRVRVGWVAAVPAMAVRGASSRAGRSWLASGRGCGVFRCLSRAADWLRAWRSW